MKTREVPLGPRLSRARGGFVKQDASLERPHTRLLTQNQRKLLIWH